MAETVPFEKALQKLEKIVSDLESGEVSLEDALKKYEEGVRLSRECQLKLSQAEKKIEILSKTLAGDFVAEPFREEDEESPCRPATDKKQKSSPSEIGNEEELLL